MSASLFMKALAVGALAVAAPSAAAAQPAKQADWMQSVAVTPEGGFRMGNPNAKVKLVEYASLTCPHCATFASASKGPIAALVRSGKLSFEYRSLILNGIDLTASIVARCAGPARFFPITDRLFATQPAWVAKISDLPQAEKDELKALADGPRLVKLAEIGGITQAAAQQGLAPAAAAKCLSDPASVQRLIEMAQKAQELGVQGTPTFFINGAMVHAHDWAELEPFIRKAGG